MFENSTLKKKVLSIRKNFVMVVYGETFKNWIKEKRDNKFLKSITIEPMTILWSLGSNIIAIPQDQMILYKTCIQPKYNLRFAIELFIKCFLK